MIISFSGIDGSGKSTQIRLQSKFLAEENFQINIKKVYANSTYLMLGELFKRIAPQQAESMVKNQFKNRSTKGFKKNLLRLIRQFCLMIDLLLYYLTTHLPYANSKKIVLCDRYFYDILVQMLYVGMCSDYFFKRIVKWIPSCKVSFLLLDTVENIRQRKIEYDMDYYQGKNLLYRGLINHFDFQVVENQNLHQAEQTIYRSIKSAL